MLLSESERKNENLLSSWKNRILPGPISSNINFRGFLRRHLLNHRLKLASPVLVLPRGSLVALPPLSHVKFEGVLAHLNPVCDNEAAVWTSDVGGGICRVLDGVHLYYGPGAPDYVHTECGKALQGGILSMIRQDLVKK